MICLSMGPPMAEEVLKYALSRCADLAILLTDRALGGADTVATANPLAFAIRKIEAEILGGRRDYYVVAGMQSVDGDTAQVPAQIAAELGIGCIAYLTDASFSDGRFAFSRIISGGSQMVTLRGLPVVLTVAKYEYPLFAGFAATRKANRVKVIQWGASDIKATQVGGKGSKTQVIRVFPPGKTNRKCQPVQSPGELAKLLVESYRGSSGGPAGTQAAVRHYLPPGQRPSNFDRSYEAVAQDSDSFKVLADKLGALGIDDLYDLDDETLAKLVDDLKAKITGKVLDELIEGTKLFDPTYKGEVWVVAEHQEGATTPATFELVGKARDLADSLGTRVGVALAGQGVAGLADELFHAGADRVYLAEHDLLANFDARLYARAISELIEKHWPQIVLYAATPACAACSRRWSRTASVWASPPTAPRWRSRIARARARSPSSSRPAPRWAATSWPRSPPRTPAPRWPPCAGRDEAAAPRPVAHRRTRPRNGGGRPQRPLHGHHPHRIRRARRRFLRRRDHQRRQGPPEPRQLRVADRRPPRRRGRQARHPGRGRRIPQRGRAGFTGRPHQVGQTGTSVGPKLHCPWVFSGAIQHMIGVANTETIIAVNNDPNAPIFKQCDYYIVGDVEKVVPELSASLGGV